MSFARIWGVMKTAGLPYLILCFVTVVRVQSQLEFKGTNVPNHGYVDWRRMAVNNLPLSCTTSVSQCCSSSQGRWVAPNGSEVATNRNSAGVYQVYNSGSIDLYVTSGVMSGMYRCDIQTGSNSGELESYFVGLYFQGK